MIYAYDGPCGCGHVAWACHRLNAQTWCGRENDLKAFTDVELRTELEQREAMRRLMEDDNNVEHT
jgi:predicted RNA methylase